MAAVGPLHPPSIHQSINQSINQILTIAAAAPDAFGWLPLAAPLARLVQRASLTGGGTPGEEQRPPDGAAAAPEAAERAAALDAAPRHRSALRSAPPLAERAERGVDGPPSRSDRAVRGVAEERGEVPTEAPY